MSTVLEIPTLDISAFVAWRKTQGAYVAGEVLPSEAQKVVDLWRAAYTTYGFSQVVGHGVSDEIIEAAHGLSKKFFETTTEEQRDAVADGVLDDRGRGYQGHKRVLQWHFNSSI